MAMHKEKKEKMKKKKEHEKEHEKHEHLKKKEKHEHHKPVKKMEKKIKKVMHEYGEGKLHSGSKSGPVVENPKQAIAIGYSEARRAKKKK